MCDGVTFAFADTLALRHLREKSRKLLAQLCAAHDVRKPEVPVAFNPAYDAFDVCIVSLIEPVQLFDVRRPLLHELWRGIVFSVVFLVKLAKQVRKAQ